MNDCLIILFWLRVVYNGLYFQMWILETPANNGYARLHRYESGRPHGRLRGVLNRDLHVLHDRFHSDHILVRNDHIYHDHSNPMDNHIRKDICHHILEDHL